METRVLFLDDSGKPDAKHPSKAVVIGGFAVESSQVSSLARRVLGAKGTLFPSRGRPQTWEVKSINHIKPGPWKRSKNRKLLDEVARLLKEAGATCYATTITKANMNHPMGLGTTMPLQLQILVEHFAVECQCLNSTGGVVADWSSHLQDQHASKCVASFVASRDLQLHPWVYYASSHATEVIQVADLISGVRRRVAEGDRNLATIERKFAKTRFVTATHMPETCRGHKFNNWVTVF